MDEYATHLPVLATCIANTKGPVLELGSGEYSTPLIHMMCKDRVVVSTDHDHEWLDKHTLNPKLPHSFRLVPRDYHKRETLELAKQNWGVVFVDHIHADYRASDVMAFREMAEIIVVHDTIWESEELDYCMINGVLDKFEYKWEHRRSRPYTSAFSMTNPLKFLPISE
jgi:hypothetical protein